MFEKAEEMVFHGTLDDEPPAACRRDGRRRGRFRSLSVPAGQPRMPQLMVKGLSRHSHFDLLWMQSPKEGFGLAKKRGLNDIPGGDALNPEQIGKLRTKGEGKNLVRRLSVQTVSANTVDMGKNQVYGILREGLKAFSFWHDVPKEGVIFFHKGLLRGTHRVAEKEMGLRSTLQILLKGKHIRKLTAIVGEEDREEFAKIQTVIGETLFERANVKRGLSGGFVFQQQTKHEIAEGEIEGHEGLAADLADDGIHFDSGSEGVRLHVSEEVGIGTALLQSLGDGIGFSMSARLKFHDTGEIQGRDGKIAFVQMSVNGGFGNAEIFGL